MNNEKQQLSGAGPVLAVFDGGLLLVLCCAVLPILIAGGALGVLDGVLGNPWLIGAGMTLMLATGVVAMRRAVRRRAVAEKAQCCVGPDSAITDEDPTVSTDTPMRRKLRMPTAPHWWPLR